MTKQHPSWEGIVPCFKSGREYLDWVKNFIQIWEHFNPQYVNYFLELRGAVNPFSYDAPISENEMCSALERSQITGEMIDIDPNEEYLPGGEREGQLDGWHYHLVFLTKDEYFRKKKEEDEMQRARTFIDRAEWHFAKTMPQIPHWYCLLKECEDKDEFHWFARYVWEHSVPGEFCGRTYKYCYLGQYKYWLMDPGPEECDLINRDEVKL